MKELYRNYSEVEDMRTHGRLWTNPDKAQDVAEKLNQEFDTDEFVAVKVVGAKTEYGYTIVSTMTM